MDQAIRGKLLDPSLSNVGRTLKTVGDLISVIGHWRPKEGSTNGGVDAQTRQE
jgi:hypothetical protein